MDLEETKFKKIVKPYLLVCRDGDWKHALRVVSWVKKLGKDRKDLPSLIIAAYLHDIGWYRILPKGKIKLDELLTCEEKANKNSSAMANKILKSLGYFHLQIAKVNRLIDATNKHQAEKEDEEILVDADNLSKLNINHLKEKFKKSEWPKLIDLWEKELPKRIKTKLGKAIYPKLLSELKAVIYSSYA